MLWEPSAACHCPVAGLYPISAWLALPNQRSMEQAGFSDTI
jgi:hypothetical protein